MEFSVTDIFNAKWLLARDTIANFFPIFIHFIQGGKVDLSFFGVEKDVKATYVACDGAVGPMDLMYNPNIPKDSVAVIPVNGIVLGFKSQMIEQLLCMANDNPNINSILLLVNSPGGSVYYTDILSNSIKGNEKPVLSYVRNICASGAMWIASSSSKIMVSSQMDQLGSIGTYTSIMDVNNMLVTKLGINIWEIYATKSTDKNIEFRNLISNGETEAIINSLDFINEIFHTTINENRGIDLGSEVYKGGIYYANDAINLGLADEISSYKQAIEQTYYAGIAYKTNNLKL